MALVQLLQKSDTIKKGETYMIELSDINTILHVVCEFIGIYACDMKIIYMERNNEKTNEYNNYTIGYRYEWQYKHIHFTSFSHLNKCNIYRIILAQ